MIESTTISDRRIAVLPDFLVDQIAAGEVIERPASVVKELIENALDAHATQIDVEIEEAGGGQIRVVDNGQGMSAADLPSAVLRHATSKIQSHEDLAAILTFGFRGEALAAIASVAHLEIIARRKGDDAGAMMFWEGGTVSDRGAVGAPVGTAVTVRHLFFNTPARREYMRAPTTETKRIIETVTDFACVHHRVAFSLAIDGRPTIRVAAAPEMRGRLIDLFGAKIGDLLIPFSGGDAELGVSGHAGKPELARQTRDRILLYVNNRRVWSQSLAHAATAAYGETIPRGRYPFAVIAIHVNPHKVDVNVHPTKREVRFAHDRAVFDVVHYSINKSVFTSPATSPVMTVSSKYEPTPPPHSERLPFTVSADRDGDIRPLGASQTDAVILESSSARATGLQTRELHGPEGPWHQVQDDSLEKSGTPFADADGVSNLWQFNDVYIAALIGEELWIIDQHTAHERVLYEEILRRAVNRKPESQRLLFPESIDLEARELEIFTAAGDVFAALGFEVRPFGTRTVLLEGIPTGLRVKNPLTLFRRVLEDIETARRAGHDLLKAAAASTACRAAVMAGDRLKREEMQALFARLMHTENPFSCPHGRPTLVKIPIADFDRKFCRA